MNAQRFAWKDMTVGVCYYPEQWDEALWADDLRRMLESGVTVVRVGEFAWSFFERTEGVFTFDLFDRFLELCTQMGMQVIFGTPTATPPAWLTEKYPEVLNADKNGVLYRHGLRKHHNHTSPVYLEKCAVITEQLAAHYGRHPAIVGWQIDNEINCETDEFYAESDSAAFREFLKARHGSLDALNRAWGTAFWNQTYTDWSEVYVPRPTLNNSLNPHMHLDYLRFVSDSAIRYCGVQAEILRRYIPKEVFITTNGIFRHLDNHRMQREHLDVFTHDSYPNFSFGLNMAGKLDTLRDRWAAKKLAEVRSVCPHFGIMEQQSGAGSWTCRMENPMPRPGQMLLWAMQSVAHGADFVSFFRWRTAAFGTEIYWHGILNYDNRDNRRMAELREFTSRMKLLAPVCGAAFAAEYAVVKDYDNAFDADVDVWHQRIAQQSEDAIFEASQLCHAPHDYAYLTEETTADELGRYRVLIMPHASIMTESRAALLEEYVRRGGTLVVGCRTGYKDENGHCPMAPQPGLLQALTATDVQDFTFATPAEEEPQADFGGKTMSMPLFNDILTPLEGARVLARFTSSYYSGEAALTEHRVGEGRVLHLGGAFGVDTARMLLDELALSEPYAALIGAPEEIELVMREKDGERYLFALNYQPHPVAVTLHRGMYSLFDGTEEAGKISLPPYGVKVWRVGA